MGKTPGVRQKLPNKVSPTKSMRSNARNIHVEKTTSVLVLHVDKIDSVLSKNVRGSRVAPRAYRRKGRPAFSEEKGPLGATLGATRPRRAHGRARDEALTGGD